MRLPVGIDVIAVTAGVTIILMAADDRSGDSAEHCTRNRSGTGPDSRQDRTCKSARAGTDYRSGRGAGYGMVIARGGCTAG